MMKQRDIISDNYNIMKEKYLNDKDIVEILHRDFPKVYNKIADYLYLEWIDDY